MKSAYLFPIALFILLGIFFLGLPDLRRCTLPRNGECSRRIDRVDAGIMAIISVLYAAIAFTGLGNTVSPESFEAMNGASVVLELPGNVYPSRIMLFSGVGEGEYSFEYSPDGITWEQIGTYEQNYVSVLKWNEFIPNATVNAPRYVLISGTGDVYLGEVAFFDGDGELLPVNGFVGGESLVDEQSTVPVQQNFLNSTYFDEIYHARTAWEQLNGVYPYEISHPPLGKLIIGIGITLFGMTPFAWRFMGTIFGIMMLPLMYIMAKKLFGGRAVPTVCMGIFACDFMHFVQTRIATIDTYSVIFIMLMYLFMYLFVSGANNRSEPSRKVNVYLAMSGICFGLGAASKWTSIYAGGGLAVIWAAYWIIDRQRGFKAFCKNALFCIAFFLLIPAVIYYLSYTPYGLARGMSAPGMYFSCDYMQLVLDNQSFMFSYHSELVSEHPYSSVWYQWLLDIRPILYYLDYFDDGTRSSFGAFVSPALCWGGLLSLFVLLYTAITRRDKTAAFILIGYLAQLLPWIFVKRLTFEYHYFPCTVFLVLSLGYCFKLIRLNRRRWQWYLGGFAAVSAALFVMFYPALSGLVVDNAATTKLLGWLPTWPF